MIEFRLHCPAGLTRLQKRFRNRSGQWDYVELARRENASEGEIEVILSEGRYRRITGRKCERVIVEFEVKAGGLDWIE